MNGEVNPSPSRGPEAAVQGLCAAGAVSGGDRTDDLLTRARTEALAVGTSWAYIGAVVSGCLMLRGNPTRYRLVPTV
ncbi:MAG: hypothetical protein EOP32_36805 [Rhodococcus sp. (in: high G+C Gram-positive bacteria)]|nr:MAG: hypothetical protein EOP32_36805 [Rhodococcus sp. (in: high G+C Gram-positive bacteria)]